MVRVLHGLLAGVLLAATAVPALADQSPLPAAEPRSAARQSPHHDLAGTVTSIRERMAAELGPDERVDITPEAAAAFLQPAERRALATGFVRFGVDRPARIYVAFEGEQGETPFWLPDLRFGRRADLDFIVDAEDAYHVWDKTVPAGEVRLGIPSLSGEMKPYLVFAAPADDGRAVTLTPLVPGTDVISARAGARPFLDDDDYLNALPQVLDGLPVLRSYESWELISRLVGWFRRTEYPSSASPDQLLLTWQGDPRHSATIQWRTDVSIQNSLLWVAAKEDFFQAGSAAGRRIDASFRELESSRIVNDPVVRLHRVRLDDLEPGTDYLYAVSADGGETWTDVREFRTAAESEPYSFVYIGDPQNGLDQWGQLLRQAEFRYPEARFYMIAGDLVDKGAERDNWDEFFHEGSPVFDESAVVPAIGNHDSHGGHPTLYLQQFALPDNGTERLDPGRTYYVEYQDLLVVVMDSNYQLIEPELQADWLDRVLGGSDARWKVVIYHHPFYASRPDRDNYPLRETWGPIFDRHRVDIAFQGHDHAYMRTVPMRGHRPAAEGEHGTIYLVAVSGTKMYEQELPAFAAFGATDTRTFQYIEVDPADGTLDYRAIDTGGRVIDTFRLEKPPAAAAD
ncbi:fibronectin type III domain-containing protein [Lentisalinibacter sediminis]|uniref:fibronectin type III domain-containing protein n=1 Tax=Lentisalinibacter sediminis TaxID=2992237 RepID=UPI003866DAB5